MQTTNLTWAQAKNMLATGMTPFVEFDGRSSHYFDYIHYEKRDFIISHVKHPPYSVTSSLQLRLMNERFRAVDTPTFPRGDHAN